MSKRVACAYIPNFPVRLLLKEKPDLAGKPVMITDTPDDRKIVFAVSEKAYKWGVREGMTPAQAKTTCPGLVIEPRDIENEERVSMNLLNALQNVGPKVEVEEPGVYYLDTTGLTLLYKSERGLAEEIISSIRSKLFPVKVGIARNKFLARLAARLSEMSKYTIVTAGTERKFIEKLPARYIEMSDDVREKLADLGIETIGEMSKYNSNDMALRFGEEGSQLSLYSNADDLNLFSPDDFAENISRRMLLTYTIVSKNQLLVHIDKLLGELLGKIAETGRATSKIQVRLRLESRDDLFLKATVDKPAVSKKGFLRQIEKEISKIKLESGITEIAITIPEAVTQTSDQIDLTKKTFTKSDPLKDKTVANIPNVDKLRLPKIENSFLPERTYSFTPVYSHRKNLKKKTPTRLSHPYSLNLISGLRLLKEPIETKVIRSRGVPSSIAVENKKKKIARQSGPWRISGGWWEDDFDRLYYEVETSDRKIYLLYFDNIQSRWFIHGIYD